MSSTTAPSSSPAGRWVGPALIFGILGLSIAMAVVSVYMVTRKNGSGTNGDEEIPNAYEIGLKEDTATATQMREDAAAEKAKAARERVKP